MYTLSHAINAFLKNICIHFLFLFIFIIFVISQYSYHIFGIPKFLNFIHTHTHTHTHMCVYIYIFFLLSFFLTYNEVSLLVSLGLIFISVHFIFVKYCLWPQIFTYLWLTNQPLRVSQIQKTELKTKRSITHGIIGSGSSNIFVSVPLLLSPMR